MNMENNEKNNIIGYCTGETSMMKVSFVSKKPITVGEYVYLEYNNQIIIGMIESLFRGTKSLDEEILNPDAIEKILTINGDIDEYIRGNITILGDEDNLEIPKTPAKPGTEVKKAGKEILKKVFEKENAIRIGTLVSEPEVPLKLDVNKMVSRHLAILAMTGAGKSNATSIIIDRLLEVNGSILIFDMHGEYEKTKFTNGESHIIEPLINPRDLSIHEYKKLSKIGENATNQERYLREAYDFADEKIKEGECTDFITTMRHEIKNLIEDAESDDSNMKKYIDAMYQVDFKLDDLRKKYGKILESTDVCDIVSNIEPGKVNIINLSSVDEIGTDIIVHHTLKNVLNRRKLVLNGKEEKKSKRLDFPLFCIIEEAHMLVSQKLPTKSKSIIGQIAREGRKFGVGLCLISQSPKSLDVDALSQINNRIILRLVEPGDQKHVQKSSENLSEDLLKQLPSLNIGEAIVLGQMTKIPTMVKIDKFEGKTVGEDLDILSLWKKSKEEKEEKIKRDLTQMDEFL